MTDEEKATRIYAAIWTLHQCVQLSQQGFLFGPWRSTCTFMIATFIAQWMAESRRYDGRYFRIALVLRNAVRLYQMPFLWDSEFWCLLTDAAVLLGGSSNFQYRTTIRYQWAVLYIAAGVWKLNTGFLSSSTSCGSIFSAQVLCLPLPGLPVALLEIVIGVLFFNNKRIGIWLCLAFHAAVALTPTPNGVPTFSLIAATRMVAFCGDLQWNWISPVLSSFSFEDNATKVFFALAPMIAMSKPILPGQQEKEQEQEQQHQEQQKGSITRTLVLLTLLYVALPVFGLQDIGAPTMFGNLKVHGGSNHHFLPTGLMQQWFASAPGNNAFGGGVVRIEGTDSVFLKQLYPGEFQLDADVVQILKGAGHIGREFGPKARRILGPDIRSNMPSLLPEVPYTIPFLELRRMVQEAPRPFSITYSYLGIKGNETWRRSKGHYTIRWNMGKNMTATMTEGICVQGDCNEAMDPTIPPPWWALKWMLFASYPVFSHTDTNEIACNY